MRFLLRRLLFYLAAAFAALTINFFIPRLMAGDPVQVMFAQFQGRLDPRAMESLRETFGFVQGPLLEQYITYLRNLAQGNLGLSVSYFPVPVIDMLAPALLWTLRLIGFATILSYCIGMLTGIFAAWRRGRFLDNFVLPVAGLIGAFPFFWVALVVLYVFAFQLGWFPTSHSYDVSMNIDWGNTAFLASFIQHSILPAITIVVTSVAGWMYGMRNNMIGVLGEDYVVLAQAKGLSDRRVMLTYAARNALLPSLTGFAMSLGYVVGGALVVEIVFSYPGMGFTLLRAVGGRDYPLMQSVFMVIVISVLCANFIADMIYVLLDPRAR